MSQQQDLQTEQHDLQTCTIITFMHITIRWKTIFCNELGVLIFFQHKKNNITIIVENLIDL